jgi:hypothetical protein
MIFNDTTISGAGTSTTNPLSANAILDSIVVLENNVTNEWLSWQITDLPAQLFKNGSPSNAATQLAAVNSFLKEVAYNVTDLFNYGNYIDGTDNPVWSAKLQWRNHTNCYRYRNSQHNLCCGLQICW